MAVDDVMCCIDTLNAARLPMLSAAALAVGDSLAESWVSYPALPRPQSNCHPRHRALGSSVTWRG